MSSLSMAMAGYNLTLPGENAPPNPGSLNAWLVKNEGYRCIDGNCNNLVLDAPDIITGGVMRLVGEWGGRCCGGNWAKPPLAVVQDNMANDSDRHMVFLAHVRNNTHFVLVNGWGRAQCVFRARPEFRDEILRLT